MMYSQGLKKMIATRGAIQMLLVPSRFAQVLAAQNMRAFSIVNVETVGILYIKTPEQK